MRATTVSAFLSLAALGPLAACAAPQLYPQPYIAKSTNVPQTTTSIAEFSKRSILSPASGKVRDLGEAYIATLLAHPSSAQFTNEFESIGKSPALCGFVMFKDESGAMTGWRPFFVEWTTRSEKGQKQPYSYEAELELAKLCGTMPQPGVPAAGAETL